MRKVLFFLCWFLLGGFFGGCEIALPPQKEEVLIAAGSFQMGSPEEEGGREAHEGAPFQVTLTRSFLMGKFEVKQGEYEALMGYNPTRFKLCGKNCPVEDVNWHMAAAYTVALSKAAGLSACFDCKGEKSLVSCEVRAAYVGSDYYKCSGYRLPTEAEWEYAYRAGTTSALYNGDLENLSCASLSGSVGEIAWFGCNAKVTYPECAKSPLADGCFGPTVVGLKKPNAWGLYDMAGNVAEWIYDGYSAAYPRQAVSDPVGADVEHIRVMRGGSWLSSAVQMRAAYRAAAEPSLRNHAFGFRVVRTAP